MYRHRFLWLAYLTLLAFPLSLSAQTTTGTVRGYVKDQNGTPVADAEVQVRQTETGVVRSSVSHGDGSYIIPGLVPADYELSVRKIGFTPQRRQITALIGATQIVDFSLQAGAVELQAVTVESAPAVELRTSEVAVNITPQQMQQLPTASRNFLDLAGLAPGVQATEDRVDGTSRSFRSGGMGANSSNVFVDGSSLKNDLTQGGVSGQDNSRGNPFPRSAIQEYRVISQNFKAEYQKATGAIITATTRSGTNQWTGNAFFGYQNKGLLALDTFSLKDKHKADSIAQKNGTPSTFRVPDYSRVLTSLSGGGPLIRDRLFVFGSYEGNYQDRASRVAIQTPVGYAALDTANLTQYNGNFTSPFRENLLFGKLNYALDQHSSLEFSFNNRHETDIKGFGGGGALSQANNFRQDVTIGQLRYNRFWGGWLNEAKVDFSRFRRDPSPDTPGTPQRMYHSSLPDIRIGSDLSTQDFVQKRVGLRDDLTYSGFQQHTFKGGVSVDFVRYDIRKLNNETPLFEYADFVDPGCWCRQDSTPARLRFAYRNPYQLTYASGAGLVSVPNTQVGAYLQDDWSPTSRLTLNLGLRWDFETNMINAKYVTPQNVADTLQQCDADRARLESVHQHRQQPLAVLRRVPAETRLLVRARQGQHHDALRRLGHLLRPLALRFLGRRDPEVGPPDVPREVCGSGFHAGRRSGGVEQQLSHGRHERNQRPGEIDRPAGGVPARQQDEGAAVDAVEPRRAPRARIDDCIRDISGPARHQLVHLQLAKHRPDRKS